MLAGISTNIQALSQRYAKAQAWVSHSSRSRALARVRTVKTLRLCKTFPHLDSMRTVNEVIKALV